MGWQDNWKKGWTGKYSKGYINRYAAENDMSFAAAREELMNSELDEAAQNCHATRQEIEDGIRKRYVFAMVAKWLFISYVVILAGNFYFTYFF